MKQKAFLGILTDSEISLIKRRTYYTWNQIDEEELIGFNAEDPFIKNKTEFAFLHNHQSARKLLKVYMSLFSCFKSVLKSIPKLNRNFRNQKTKIIDAYCQCKKYISTRKFEILTDISSKKISRWVNDIHCENSFLSLCKKQHPKQLTFEEQNVILTELQNPDNDHLFICDIWAKLLRGNFLNCKLETFYKYSRIISKKLGLRKRKIKKVIHSIIAKEPLSILHVDCTMIRTDDGGKWYLNIIFDNYSKAILGIKAMLNPNSFDVMRNLKNVIDEYQLHDKSFSLYCDGGPENRGEVDKFLRQFPLVKKFVTSFSNGIHNNNLEAFNSKFKRKLIFFLDLSRHEKIPGQLEALKHMYDNSPQALIGTLTPNEILEGLRPWKDQWPELKSNIEQAKNERLLVNQLSCCVLTQ